MSKAQSRKRHEPTPPKAALVYYCPGNAVGSPALLPKDRAEAQCESDTAHLRKLQAVGATPDGTLQLPHIGGTCKVCKNRL